MSADPMLANYRFLAGYNRWLNERLYDACGQLTDDNVGMTDLIALA